MKRSTKGLIYACVLGLLLLVFSMYSRPDFLMTLANQVWNCF